MTIYADVFEGECVNIIVAEEDFRPAFEEAFPDHEMVGPLDDLSPYPGIGWSYVDGQWSPPPEAEPEPLGD